MGAAIADAMGGPVECQHYKRIAKMFPDFQEYQPYNTPPATIFPLRSGYALDDAPGSVTDDTFIRMDLAKYLLQNEPPYSAASFAPWLLEHAEFPNWWRVAVRPLERIEKGEVSPEEAGLNHRQGGGGGWWQPVAMLYAADPGRASAVTADMCRIWKAPLEQDILSSVVAGQTAAFHDDATIDSVVDAVLSDAIFLIYWQLVGLSMISMTDSAVQISHFHMGNVGKVNTIRLPRVGKPGYLLFGFHILF